MDFGSLQAVTAWRLTRPGLRMCQGIVVHGPGGFRLVVIEDQQIVEWTRVSTASALRQHVKSTVKRLRRAGWHVHHTHTMSTGDGARPAAPLRRPRGSGDRHLLLRIAEQAAQ